ncbi:hypothetical protein SADUNF_Sadunf18G0084600 [Salix dunnii]|uniref:Uncharacterized protein n=1 Tax=Salix dunnii TaxID=1413687 RepID=A0A835J6N6_9ROSI|nr:hypothetical protein SADUNF_Sadunf18G0084600 [Salix dunnii]
MRGGIVLPWLLVIACVKALSYYACEGTVTPQQHNTLMIRRDGLHNVFGMAICESKEKGDRRRLEGGVHEVDLKSLQRAKGVYGGADMLRPRTKSKNGAYALLLKPFAILSKTVVGFVMFLVFF